MTKTKICCQKHWGVHSPLMHGSGTCWSWLSSSPLHWNHWSMMPERNTARRSLQTEKMTWHKSVNMGFPRLNIYILKTIWLSTDWAQHSHRRGQPGSECTVRPTSATCWNLHFFTAQRQPNCPMIMYWWHHKLRISFTKPRFVKDQVYLYVPSWAFYSR